MSSDFFIDLTDAALSKTRRKCLAEQLYTQEKRKPKNVLLITYTLAPETIDWLNELVEKDVDVLVFACQLPNSTLSDCRFPCRINKHLHAKAIVFNRKKGWLVTANAVADTMINLGVPLTKSQLKKLLTFMHSLLFGSIKHQTHLL